MWIHKRLGRYIYSKTLSMYGKTTSFGWMTVPTCVGWKNSTMPKTFPRHFQGISFCPNIQKHMGGCFLKWWYPKNTPKWSVLVGKPMVVGYHHFRKPPHWLFNNSKQEQTHSILNCLKRVQPQSILTPQNWTFEDLYYTPPAITFKMPNKPFHWTVPADPWAKQHIHHQ